MRGNNRAKGKSQGFALVAVLIIAVIGVIFLGVVLHMMDTSSGVDRAAIRQIAAYNVLGDAVERGKAELRQRMDNTTAPPRWNEKPGATARIETVEMLLIENGEVENETLGPSDLRKRNLGGRSGRLQVQIFDMQYDPTLVDITGDELNRLPPSIVLPASSEWTSRESLDAGEEEAGSSSSASNAGVYLIRATLEVDGKTHVLDSSLVQANNL